jgi:hypothetical protein
MVRRSRRLRDIDTYGIRRQRYNYAGNAILAGEHAPAYIEPKTRFKRMPKGSGLVDNASSLFDIGTGAAGLGAQVISSPRETYERAKLGLHKDVEREEHYYKYKNPITAPIYKGIVAKKQERPDANEGIYRAPQGQEMQKLMRQKARAEQATYELHKDKKSGQETMRWMPKPEEEDKRISINKQRAFELIAAPHIKTSYKTDYSFINRKGGDKQNIKFTPSIAVRKFTAAEVKERMGRSKRLKLEEENRVKARDQKLQTDYNNYKIKSLKAQVNQTPSTGLNFNLGTKLHASLFNLTGRKSQFSYESQANLNPKIEPERTIKRPTYTNRGFDIKKSQMESAIKLPSYGSNYKEPILPIKKVVSRRTTTVTVKSSPVIKSPSILQSNPQNIQTSYKTPDRSGKSEYVHSSNYPSTSIGQLAQRKYRETLKFEVNWGKHHSQKNLFTDAHYLRDTKKSLSSPISEKDVNNYAGASAIWLNEKGMIHPLPDYTSKKSPAKKSTTKIAPVISLDQLSSMLNIKKPTTKKPASKKAKGGK